VIRPAVEADIPRITDWVERLVEAVNGPQRVDRIKTGQTLAGLIASPDGFVAVSDHGFIAACLSQTIISPDRVAIECGWYAEREGLSLLRAFEDWADDKGATLKVMSCKGGAAKAILTRQGYRLSEEHLVK
jgi:hypothetical protein